MSISDLEFAMLRRVLVEMQFKSHCADFKTFFVRMFRALPDDDAVGLTDDRRSPDAPM